MKAKIQDNFWRPHATVKNDWVKRAILVASLALLTAGLNFKTEWNIQRPGYRGKVKSVHQEYVSIRSDDGKRIETVLSRGVSKYDADGNLIENIHYNPDGTIRYRRVILFDEARRESTEDMNRPANIKTIAQRVTAYDEAGNAVEVRSYFGDGSLLARQTLKYDDSGRLIERAFYSPEGKKTQTITTTRDGDSWTEISVSESTGQRFSDSMYDARRGRAELKDYGDDGKLRRYATTYFDQNDRVAIEYEGLQSPWNFPLTRYQYEGDSRGNWTKQTKYECERDLFIFEDCTMVSATNRTFEYYD